MNMPLKSYFWESFSDDEIHAPNEMLGGNRIQKHLYLDSNFICA